MKKIPEIVTPLTALVISVLPVHLTSAANGPAYYFDVDGATPGFGFPSGSYNKNAAIWTTDITGSSETVVFPTASPGRQLTFGAVDSDFDGSIFTLTLDGSYWAGIVVNSTNANITLTGTPNSYIHDDSTWMIMSGSTLIDSDTRQNFASDGSVKGINWNSKAVTFTGGGTIDFQTPFGANNGSAVQTENMSGGTINLLMAYPNPAAATTYGGGFILQNGTLNFASAGSAYAFAGFTAGHNFAINGGTIDNTSGSPLTAFVGTQSVDGTSGGISLGGNFTFAGSSDLDFGTAAVALTSSAEINVKAARMTFGGTLTGSGFSLTKTGAGTLVLGGSNNNYGDTIVNNGTVEFHSVSPASAITVGAGAAIDFSTAGPVVIGNLSLSDATMTVGFDSLSSAVTTPSLTLDGGNIVNVATLPANADYPVQVTIIKYTGLNGDYSFTLGTMPESVGAPYVAYVSNNVANSSIDLVVVSGPAPLRNLSWSGAVDGNWDTTTANWRFEGASAMYRNLESVRFDDTAGGNTAVNLTGTLTPGNVVVSNQSKAYGFGGPGSLSGATGITKEGAGTLYLTNSGFNDFTGNMVINAGAVHVGEGSFSGNLGSGNVINNGRLSFDRADDISVANIISGSGGLTKNGAGALALSGNNSFEGEVIVNAGTLRPGSSTALGGTNGATILASGASLDVNAQNLGGESVTISGTGVGGYAIFNSGVQSLNALRYVTLAGDTTLGGDFRWDIRGAPSTADPVNAALSTDGHAYKLIKKGFGQVSIVGAAVDPMLGDVEVQEGVFSLEAATTGLGNPTNTLTIMPSATLQLYQLTNRLNKVIHLASDTFTDSIINSSGANTIIGPITLNSDCIINVGGTSLTLEGALAGAQLIKNGNGTLVLDGEAAHAGTILNAGTTILNGLHHGPISPGPIGFLSSFAGNGTNLAPVDLAGAFFPGNTNEVGTITVGGLTLESGATMSFDFGPLATVGGGVNDLIQINGDLTVNGNSVAINPHGLLQTGVPYRLANYTGSLIVNGDLSITGPNNYVFTVDTSTPGQINVVASGGPPVWNGGSAVGSYWSDAANWSGVTVQPNDPLSFNGATRLNNTNDTADATTYNGMIFGATSGAFTLNGNSFVLNGSIVNNSSSTQTFNLPLSFNTGANFDGGNGALAINNGITNSSGSGIQTLTLSGRGSVSDAIGSTGARTTFTTTSTADWKVLDNSAATPVSILGQLNIIDGGSLTIGSVSSAPNVTLLGADATSAERSVIGNAKGTSVLNMVNGSLVIPTRLNVGNGAAGATVNLSGGTLTIQGVTQIADNNINTVGTVNVSGGTLDMQMVYITSRGTGALNISGGSVFANTVELARDLGGQTPHGSITLNGGNLQVDRIQSSSTVSGSTAAINFNGGTLAAARNDGTFMNLNVTTPIMATVQAGGAVIDTGAFGITIPVPLVHDSALGMTADGGLTKLGSGTLTLSGASTYNGPTRVNAGTLVVNGATAAGAVTVSSGGSLSGNGTLGGSVTVNDGGTIAPAGFGSTGTLTVNGDIALEGVSVLEVNKGASGQDLLTASGDIQYGGTLIVTNISGTLMVGDSFKVFNAANYNGAFISVAPPGDGFAWDTSDLNRSGTLKVVSSSAAQPLISSVSVVNGSLVLSGSNGSAGATYRVLTSTDLALPVAQWTAIATNNFDEEGNFSFTNGAAADAQRFYLLRVP